MKLFNIRTNDSTTDLYFASKQAAKAKRNELNGGTPKELEEAKKPMKYFVAPGPDHCRG